MNKTKKFKNLLEKELIAPFRYEKDDDIRFVNAFARYITVKFLSDVDEIACTPDITSFWRQRIISRVNHELRNNEECWFPDGLCGKCFVEVPLIKNEDLKDTQERLDHANHRFAPAIAAYHEAVLCKMLARITPEFRQVIINLYSDDNKEGGHR